jgi:hypothetical protein
MSWFTVTNLYHGISDAVGKVSYKPMSLLPGSTVLKWILKKLVGGGVWTGLMRLRVGTGGRLF